MVRTDAGAAGIAGTADFRRKVEKSSRDTGLLAAALERKERAGPTQELGVEKPKQLSFLRSTANRIAEQETRLGRPSFK